MTNFLLIFFALVAAVAAGLGRALWRQRKPVTPPAPADWQSLTSRAAVLDTYAPLNRLFRQEDFAFLAAQPGARRGLLRQLRRQRWNVLRLYLKELGADFENVSRICRRLAASSEEPDFAPLVTRHALRIRGLLLALHLCCWLRWTGSIEVQAANLVEAFRRFDLAVRAVAPALTLQPSVSSKRA